MLRQIVKFFRNNRGQSTLEFALVIPIFLLLVCGIVDFGSVYYQSLTVNQAAREAARVAAVSRNVINAKQAAKNYGTSFAVTITPAMLASGTNVTVTVSNDVTIMTPLMGSLFPSNPYRVSGTAIMQVE